MHNWMIYVILVILTLLCFFVSRRIIRRLFFKAENLCEVKENEYRNISNQIESLKSERSGLEITVQETIELFNLTKDICKSLDEGTVFSLFREQIGKYINIDGCSFIKGKAAIKQHSQDIKIMPLEIEKNEVGYLVAKGVKKDDSEKFQILSEQFMLGMKRALLYQRVQEMSITDSYTGIFSRRYFMERLKEEIERAKKHKYAFSFLMVDIDNFKPNNDRYGHLVGDLIIKKVVETIRENTRQIDTLGRYGGDEFSIILSETHQQEAELVAERIRKAIEVNSIHAYDETIKITVSIGISVFPQDADEPELLVEQSDSALYRAKKAGKNKVCLYQSA